MEKFTLGNLQRVALYLYVFSIHFETWDPFHTGINYLFTKITISIFLFLTLLSFKTFYSLKNIRFFAFPLIIYFILLTINNYKYKSGKYSEFFDLPFFLNMLMLVAISNNGLKDERVFKGIFNSYIYGGIVLTLFYFLNIETNHSWYGRSTIFGFNQNQLAVNLAIIIILMISPFATNKIAIRRSTLINILFIPLLLIFLAATGSRSGILSLILGLFVLFYFQPLTSTKRKVITLFWGSIVLSAIILYFSSNEIVSQRFADSFYEGDSSGRDLRWIAVIDIILENPIWGIGKIGYENAITNAFGIYTSPHNVLLETTVFTGFVGLSMILYFFIIVTKAAILIKNKLNNQLAIALLMPVLIMTLVGHTFGSKAAFIIIAYIISYKVIQIKSF